MDTEVLLIYDAADGQGIESVHEHLEELLSVFLVAFLLEVVQLGHYSRLMIASEHDYVLG